MSSKLTKRKTKDLTAPETKGAATDDEKARYVALIEEASEKAPANIRPYLKQAAPILAMAVIYFQVALPHIIQFVTFAQEKVAQLPQDVLYCILGGCVCFFGGVFPATIAAFEAWQLCGGKEAIEHCKSILTELEKLEEANKTDDSKDEDNDGVVDVNQLTPKELVARKARLAVKTVDPEHISHAISGIYTGWIGVLAVLKIQFAKAVTLGEVLGQRLYEVAKRGEPALEAVLPEEYHKWVPLIVRWTCKGFAIWVAWWIQRIISAVHSAIRGGHIFAEHLTNLLKAKNISIPLSSEVFAWAICFAGLVFQWICGFGVPFPLSLVMWPLNIVEYFIIWSLTSSSNATF